MGQDYLHFLKPETKFLFLILFLGLKKNFMTVFKAYEVQKLSVHFLRMS